MKRIQILFAIIACQCAFYSSLSAQEKKNKSFASQASIKDFEVYPNPALGKVKIFFNSPLAGQGYITVLNKSGIAVSKRKAEFLTGKNYWDQQLPNQGTASFWIEIRIDTIVRKVMVNSIHPGTDFKH